MLSSTPKFRSTFSYYSGIGLCVILKCRSFRGNNKTPRSTENCIAHRRLDRTFGGSVLERIVSSSLSSVSPIPILCKVKLSRYATQTPRERGCSYNSFLTLALDGGENDQRHAPAALYPW
jgi:hypothetical protein